MLTRPIADCKVPVMGIFSSNDVALTEEQMLDSKKYVRNTWRYERIDSSAGKARDRLAQEPLTEVTQLHGPIVESSACPVS